MAEGPYEKGEVRTWERDPKVPIRATKNVVVWAWVVKEFPYMKQNERIKFIRVGDTVKNSRPVQGITHVEWGRGGGGSLVHFYTQGTRSGMGILRVIC